MKNIAHLPLLISIYGVYTRQILLKVSLNARQTACARVEQIVGDYVFPRASAKHIWSAVNDIVRMAPRENIQVCDDTTNCVSDQIFRQTDTVDVIL